MPLAPDPLNRGRGHLGRGALFSLFLHAAALAPIGVLAFVWAAREEAQRAEEVDVGFESVPEEQLPAGLPPLEPPNQDQDVLEKLKPDAKKPPKKKPEKPALAKEDAPKPKPESEIVVPPLPPMPAAPRPPPPERHDNMKMVDVENDKNVPPPPDAKFLAEKNNRVAEETRAKQTNLEKNSKGDDAPASAPSDLQDEQVGGQKQQIRQLADEKA